MASRATSACVAATPHGYAVICSARTQTCARGDSVGQSRVADTTARFFTVPRCEFICALLTGKQDADALRNITHANLSSQNSNSAHTCAGVLLFFF